MNDCLIYGREARRDSPPPAVGALTHSLAPDPRDLAARGKSETDELDSWHSGGRPDSRNWDKVTVTVLSRSELHSAIQPFLSAYQKQ
jgi:hypothetical protein